MYGDHHQGAQSSFVTPAADNASAREIDRQHLLESLDPAFFDDFGIQIHQNGLIRAALEGELVMECEAVAI
jgi:hypothetical protein